MEGLLAFLPADRRQIGWKPAFLLRREGDERVSEETIERSWTGAYRKSQSPVDASLPIAIAIAPTQLFVTSAGLPATAARDLSAACELRLDTLSPLPPAEIAFACGSPSPTSTGRIDVPIAIVRRSTLDETEQRVGRNSLFAIGADPDDNGRFRFVFRRYTGGRRGAWDRPAIGSALLVAAVLLLAVGLDHFLENRVRTEERYAAALTEELRTLRASSSFLDGAPQAPRAPKPAAIAADIARLVNRLPEGARVERVTLNADALLVTGWSPEGADWGKDADGALTRQASKRPGYEDFSLQTVPSDG